MSSHGRGRRGGGEGTKDRRAVKVLILKTTYIFECFPAYGVRVVLLVRDTSSWPVLHNYEVSWLNSIGFSSYGADRKLHMKQSRGNNSESMKARVVILVRNTLSWPVLHRCEVSWLYSKRYSSYRVHTKLHPKWSTRNNSDSMKARVAILVCDTLSWPV